MRLMSKGSKHLRLRIILHGLYFFPRGNEFTKKNTVDPELARLPDAAWETL